MAHLIQETPSHFLMSDGKSQFRVPRDGLSESFVQKIRSSGKKMADGGEVETEIPPELIELVDIKTGKKLKVPKTSALSVMKQSPNWYDSADVVVSNGIVRLKEGVTSPEERRKNGNFTTKTQDAGPAFNPPMPVDPEVQKAAIEAERQRVKAEADAIKKTADANAAFHKTAAESAGKNAAAIAGSDDIYDAGTSFMEDTTKAVPTPVSQGKMSSGTAPLGDEEAPAPVVSDGNERADALARAFSAKATESAKQNADAVRGADWAPPEVVAEKPEPSPMTPFGRAFQGAQPVVPSSGPPIFNKGAAIQKEMARIQAIQDARQSELAQMRAPVAPVVAEAKPVPAPAIPPVTEDPGPMRSKNPATRAAMVAAQEEANAEAAKAKLNPPVPTTPVAPVAAPFASAMAPQPNKKPIAQELLQEPEVQAEEVAQRSTEQLPGESATAYKDRMLLQQMEIERDIGSQKAAVEQGYQDQVEEFENQKLETRQKYLAKLQKASDFLANDPDIDQNHYWASQGTPGKILGIIGLVLGVFGADKDGTNRASVMLDKAIERDIAIQKMNHEIHQKKGAAMQKSADSFYALAEGNMKGAEALARKVADSDIARIMANTSDQGAKNKFALLRADNKLKEEAAARQAAESDSRLALAGASLNISGAQLGETLRKGREQSEQLRNKDIADASKRAGEALSADRIVSRASELANRHGGELPGLDTWSALKGAIPFGLGSWAQTPDEVESIGMIDELVRIKLNKLSGAGVSDKEREGVMRGYGLTPGSSPEARKIGTQRLLKDAADSASTIRSGAVPEALEEVKKRTSPSRKMRWDPKTKKMVPVKE